MLPSMENGTDVETGPAVEKVAPPSQSATEEAFAGEGEAARRLLSAVQDAPIESKSTANDKSQTSQYSSLGADLLRKCEFQVANTTQTHLILFHRERKRRRHHAFSVTPGCHPSHLHRDEDPEPRGTASAAGRGRPGHAIRLSSKEEEEEI